MNTKDAKLFSHELTDTKSTYKAIIRFPILKNDKSRQGFYSVFISNARILLSVNFHHLDRVFQDSTDFIENWDHKLARTTPAKP